MMGFSVLGEILGQESLVNKLNHIVTDAYGRQIKSVQEATLAIHKVAVELIAANTDGTPTIRYGAKGKDGKASKRTVYVSYPGDPPNSDTGRLMQSIEFDFPNEFTGRVGTGLKYGAYLEFGTLKMEPRPWLSTAVETVSEEIGEIFERNLKGLGED